MSTDQARLVIIEGPDASGKTAVADCIAAMLDAPTSPIAARAFHHTRNGGSSDLYIRALDYAHQRAALCRATDNGMDDVILCDRWWHSTHVEAFRTSDSALGTLARAEEIALPRPLLVVVLDAPDHVLDARMAARGEKPTQADRDRRSIYRECAGPAHAWDGETITRVMRGGPPPVVVVDSSGAVEDTAKRVATEVLRAMGRPVVGWDGDGREVACVG